MERALLVLSQKFEILLQVRSGYYEFKQGKNSVNVLFFFWSHKKAFFLLAIPCNSSIFALAEEKCGVMKLFLTRRKLVILFKSRNRTSIKMFHADHIGSGVQAYLLVLWVYQYLEMGDYVLRLSIDYQRGLMLIICNVPCLFPTIHKN